MTAPAMQTKRRYAHELYPHPGEFEVRPLTVEVPYLYAIGVGWDFWGTGWFDRPITPESAERSMTRTMLKIAARQRAMLADALLQGMTGEAAWQWAEERAGDPEGEVFYERAVHYGVNPRAIKPYPCGPEPDHHDHVDEPDARGLRLMHRVEGRESDCPECCEPAGGSA